MINVPTDDEIEAARSYIHARARFLVGGLKGRGKLDPEYVRVTEGRDTPAMWSRYSSCGDLPQALAFELGCRQPFVNRKEHEGWRPGRNLLDFYAGANAPAAPCNEVPNIGAFCFIWSDSGRDAHALVAGRQVTQPDGTRYLETFNYGAGGMSAHEFPGAHESLTPLREAWRVALVSGAVSTVLLPMGRSRTLAKGERSQTKLTGVWLGARRLRYALDVPRLLELCDPDLIPPMSGEVLDAMDAQTA